MKTKRLITFLTGITLATTGAFALGCALSNKKAEPVSADTSRTVYYAIDSSVVGTYTVKVNANIGDNNTWRQSTMTKTSKTFHGMSIYQGSFEEKYGGVDALQFQLYDGSTWKSQTQPISSWTLSSVFDGKLYVHGIEGTDGFKTYAYDTSSVTVYVDGFDWSETNMYFHVYDDICDYYGGWPGYFTGYSDKNLTFNGGRLQKFTFPIISGKNTKFQYNDNNGHQSDSLTPVNNAYYWHNGSAWVSNTGDLASAAAFVWDLNTARLAVTASGSTKAYSICGLSASTWVSRYNSLGTAKSYVDSASIYTYKDKNSSGADTTVTFAEVMEELSERASGGSSGSAHLGFSNEKNNSVAIIVIISLVSVTAIGGFFFIRKRREN